VGVVRVIAFGRGYIGQAFEKAGVTVYSRDTYDYTNVSIARSLIYGADVVINCAGFTGRPNIDECEVKRRETIEANVVLPANLSRICRDSGKTFVHISSGCIYQGAQNFSEDDPPSKDLSFYSQTKAMVEQVIDGYVLRIRMPFCGELHPRNLITKLMGYSRLISYENSLTYIPDLVGATMMLLAKEAPHGIYNVVNTGSVTHRDIVEIFQSEGHPWDYAKFVDIEDIPIKTVRSNCTLDNRKLSKYFVMPNVRQRLTEAAKSFPINTLANVA
jgi:dTDP-4-dehydrorhamnose reductase